jgi:hypothetical protein
MDSPNIVPFQLIKIDPSKSFDEMGKKCVSTATHNKNLKVSDNDIIYLNFGHKNTLIDFRIQGGYNVEPEYLTSETSDDDG